MTRKFEAVIKDWKAEAHKYRRKLSLKSSHNLDFAEEIKTYLSDGISDLKAEGYTEKEALQITLEKFEDAELQDNFTDFMNEFNDFGMEEHKMKAQQLHMENGEILGVYYGGFTILGMTIGGLLLFLTSGGVPEFLDSGWIYTLIGLGVGTLIGIGCGLISHGIVMSKRK